MALQILQFIHTVFQLEFLDKRINPKINKIQKRKNPKTHKWMQNNELLIDHIILSTIEYIIESV